MHCVCINMWVQVPQEPETSDPPGAGVPGGCELPYMGPVNRTCVPCTAVHALNHWTIISNPILCNSDFTVLLVLVSIFISFKNIFTSLLVSLLTQWLVKSVLSNSYVFIHFFSSFCWFLVGVHCGLRQYVLWFLSFVVVVLLLLLLCFCLLWLVLWLNTCPLLGHIPCADEKNAYSAAIRWYVLWMSITSICSIV